MESLSPLYILSSKLHIISSPAIWNPPVINFTKLNLNGASKGNSMLPKYGVSFRNVKGYNLQLYVGSLGWYRNNATKPHALYWGIYISTQQNYIINC